MVVTQVETDIVVNRVGKSEARLRIAVTLLSVEFSSNQRVRMYSCSNQRIEFVLTVLFDPAKQGKKKPESKSRVSKGLYRTTAFFRVM